MHRKFSLSHTTGFTAIEMLMVVAIIGVLSVSIARFQTGVWSLGRSSQAGLNAADQARRILNPMADQIRAAIPGATGAYDIESATATEIIFYSDINHDGLGERVRYFLSSGAIKSGVTYPSGTPSTYNTATETVRTLVSGVTSATVFSYYDANYTGSSSALSFPVTPSQVRLVKISFTVDSDPNKPPAPFAIETQITLRNVKDNL